LSAGEVLVSVNNNECYILPSAHFPLLLTFNVDSNQSKQSASQSRPNSFLSDEKLYRTKVEVTAIRGSASPMKAPKHGSFEGTDGNERDCVVQAATVSGAIKESGRRVPLDEKSKIRSWDKDGILTFNTRSCWCVPQTLSLALFAVPIGDDGHERVVHSDEKGKLHYASEIGHCWVDLKPLWEIISKISSSNGSKTPPSRLPVATFKYGLWKPPNRLYVSTLHSDILPSCATVLSQGRHVIIF